MYQKVFLEGVWGVTGRVISVFVAEKVSIRSYFLVIFYEYSEGCFTDCILRYLK